MFGGVLSSVGAKSVNNSHLGSTVSARRKVSVTDCARRLLYMKWLLCKQAKQLEPSLHCLRLHRGAGREAEVQYVAPAELLGHAVRERGQKPRVEILQVLTVA